MAKTDPVPSTRPLLPRDAAEPPSADVLAELYRFHLDPPPPEAPAAAPWVPALLRGRRPAGEYPLFLGPPEAGEEAAYLSLPDLLRRAAPDAGAETPLEDRFGDLAENVRRLSAGRDLPVDAGQLLRAAGGALVAAAGQGTEEAERLDAALEALIAAVPAGGRLLPFSEQAPLHLLAQAARCRLLPALEALREEARARAAEARALLLTDRLKLPESRQSAAVESAMGELGSTWVDPSALSEVLDERGGGSALPALRRERLEDAVRTIEAYLGEKSPALVVVHDDRHGIAGLEELEPAVAGEWRLEPCGDPCACAAEVFDREAERIARVLRAIRRVRLEAEGRHDPELQDPWIERFDWQAFSRRELQLLTPVAVLLGADRARRGMVSLSSLLLSGRPVQVLVPVAPAANPGTEDGEPLSGFRFEPAYLGLSCREVLVLQTATAMPAHLASGCRRALASTHASLLVVASGACAGGARPPLGAEAHSAAALEGRAHPLLLYDPDAGTSWADRLDFTHNPQPGGDWPVHELEVRREGGDDQTLSLAFTYADFALLEPVYAHHFRPVPEGTPDDALVPVTEYSSRPVDDGATGVVPYVWGIDDAARLVRLAVSRPLALACRDRLEFWRILQELAGVSSEYVRRAEARTRRQAEEQAKAEREALEARHAGELERVRRDAARDVVDRLTAALLEVDVAALAGSAPPAARALAGLGDGSVDGVAAALLELVGEPALDGEGPEPAASEEVERVASELLGLVADEKAG